MKKKMIIKLLKIKNHQNSEDTEEEDNLRSSKHSCTTINRFFVDEEELFYTK